VLVGIISDLHSNLTSLEIAFKIFDEYGVEQIICAGDIVGYYTEPVKCLELLRERTDHVVVGNHDAIAVSDNFKSEIRYFNDIARQSLVWTRNTLKDYPEHWSYLKDLPFTKIPRIDGINFFIVHSTPLNPEDWDYFYYFGVSDQDDELSNWLDMFTADVMIMGHTHVPFIFQTEEEKKKTVLNPGSTGQPRDGDPRASMMLFDTKTRKVQHVRYKYNIKTVCKGITANNLHKYLCDRLYKGR
jgi:putative phosphoesterase